MNASTSVPSDRIATGIAGLDDILGGGFPRDRLYLVEGSSGSGKTTLSLQFLLEGVRCGETGLYITLSETLEELRAVADSHGWSLDAIRVCDLASSEESLKADAQYTVFHPSEVELGETTQAVLDEVERARPAHVVIDSLSEVRLLVRDPLRYRRQMLALKQFFTGRQCTVLLLDDRLTESDLQLHCLTHGVLALENLSPPVWREPPPPLDAMMGGGLDRGTSTLIPGAAGTGKSTLAAQCAAAVAERGEAAALYIFEETAETMFARLAALGIDIRGHVETGRMAVRHVDPAELSPGEFAHLVREAVEKDGARLVAIDSLNGYLAAMPEERFLAAQLHELLAYLSRQGVLTLLVMSQYGLLGGSLESPVDVSSLADTVLLLRYFEAGGHVRRAISVVKKRSGAHETAIRELRIGPESLRLGGPLTEFHGVLAGLPSYHGTSAPLLQGSDGQSEN